VSSKTCNKAGVFVTNPKDINNIEENMNILEDWKLFGITHNSFQNYASKTIEWHEKANTNLKSTFYTKEHYNELKNQLRSLQNAKNELAKSQLYEGKHVKRESLLDDEDLKLAACIWLRSIPPKDRSFLALKKELETNIFSKLLEEDKREYCKGWAMRMMNYQKKMEQYDTYFYANDDNSFVWIEDKESIIKKKGQGSAIMASDFLCPCHGPLHLTKANAIRLGLDQEARVIIKLGQQANVYWKSKNMVQQLREKAIPIFNALYPECIGIVSNSSISTNYNAYALDALVCSRMTLYPKVENKFKFKDGWYIRDYEKITQLMFFLDKNDGTVKFKGIKKPDFLEQKTSIAETVKAAGHIFELYSKFHCEYNFIERFWSAAKRIARQQCDYSYAQLQLRVPEILNNIPLPIIR
ncbi:3549_t:CDS:2, partial [Gigaspora margarita]